jgi:deoxyhypusine monooxygenase
VNIDHTETHCRENTDRPAAIGLGHFDPSIGSRVVQAINTLLNVHCELPVMSGSSLSDLRDCLLDIDGSPIAKRTHAAFLLRTEGSEKAASFIAEALNVRRDSELMRHELAYILGQMQHSCVCDQLERILRDETDDVIVRHECAESLGAIGQESSIPVLREFCAHPAREISETCQIAIDLVNWKSSQNMTIDRVGTSGDYLSHDPAPPVELEGKNTAENIETLRSKLMDERVSLFNRYRAMFALRNMNTDASAMALVDGFRDSSALFRHEIAYVLGQMQRSVTAEALSTVLRNSGEHAMVRHEAAEALGAIGGAAAESVLREFLNDPEQVVQESCQVALGIMDHWAPAQE